jgi:hypothetical protein
MKKRYALLSMILFVGISMSFNSCKKDSDDDPDEVSYERVTVDHFLGFDFSENIAQDSDGAVIGWQPGGETHANYNSDGDYLWWITRSITGDPTNKTNDMGTIALSSITEAPTSWELSPNITPLLVGHVYVAKCIDGYVKFEVLSVSPSVENWPVEIKYSFSSTSTFDN